MTKKFSFIILAPVILSIHLNVQWLVHNIWRHHEDNKKNHKETWGFALFCLKYLNSSYCVFCQAKIVGKSSYTNNFSGYDEYVPMVDKPVDAVLKKQASLQRSYTSQGLWLWPGTFLIYLFDESSHFAIYHLIGFNEDMKCIFCNCSYKTMKFKFRNNLVII